MSSETSEKVCEENVSTLFDASTNRLMSPVSSEEHLLEIDKDIFKVVREEQIPEMLEVLQRNWPKNFTLFQMVTMMREYKQAGSPWQHTIFLYGDYETGVYLHRLRGEIPKEDWIMLYLYTPSSTTSVKKCLEETKIIPWEDGDFYFHMSSSRFRSAIQAVCVSKNINCTVTSGTLFWYPPENEFHPKNIPHDVRLDFINESHVDELNKNWMNRTPRTENIVAEHIRRDFGLGIFRKFDMKLLCAGLSTFTGGIFVLYTDQHSQKKGYASLLLEQMAMEMRRRKRIPFAIVPIGKTKAEHTLFKIGFERCTSVDNTFINKSN